MLANKKLRPLIIIMHFNIIIMEEEELFLLEFSKIERLQFLLKVNL